MKPLWRYVLTAKHGYRIAVIMNECGEEVGIERAMMQPEVHPCSGLFWDWAGRRGYEQRTEDNHVHPTVRLLTSGQEGEGVGTAR